MPLYLKFEDICFVKNKFWGIQYVRKKNYIGFLNMLKLVKMRGQFQQGGA